MQKIAKSKCIEQSSILTNAAETRAGTQVQKDERKLNISLRERVTNM